MMEKESMRETLPLTMAQQGIWVGQQLDPSNPMYWTAEFMVLRGPLRLNDFVQAVQDTINACEALHMRYFHEEGQLRQMHQPDCSWPLHRLDFSSHTHAEEALRRWIQADLQSPVDLEKGPLFNTALMCMGQNHHVWYFRSHHIALDGFAYALLMNRLMQAYQPEACSLEIERPFALKDVIEEDQAYQASSAFQRDRQFWLNALGQNHAAVTLVPAAPLARSVLRYRGGLDLAQFEQIKHSAQQAGVDWSVLVLATIAACLHRSTGVNRLTLGLPVMNRLGSVSLTVPCMGMNIIALLVELHSEQTIQDVVQHIHQQLKTIRLHQRYRYEQLKRDLGGAAGGRRLFGPVVNIMPFDRPLDVEGLEVTQHPVSSGPVEDIAFTLVPHAQGLRLDIEANPNAYRAESLQAFHRTLQASLLQVSTVLSTVLSDVPAFSKTHNTQGSGLSMLRGPSLFNPVVPVLEAIRLHAFSHPNDLALVQDGQGALSYAELLRAVQALAGTLNQHGIGYGDCVVVLLPRSPQTIVSILAVMWCGAADVPLDPVGPVSRLNMVLDDAKPALVLTLREHAQHLPNNQKVLCLDGCDDRQIDPLYAPVVVPSDALAYLMYTSGSTGKPNGVRVSRQALDHFVAAANLEYKVQVQDRVLQFAPFHFDASVEEIFLSLCNGATLVLRTEAMLESMPTFLNACERLQISVLDLPTAFWHELAYALGCGRVQLPNTLRLVLIGGEAAMPERLRRWCEHAPAHLQLLNTYGPTEATVICTTAHLAGPQASTLADGVPIGTPLAGVNLYVVDEHLHPVPQGQAGELCISGPTLAQGYLNRPEPNQKRFVCLNAVHGRPRVYRTGDRVVLSEDGALRYLGRLDDEFKISGHRIDPTEVETTLLQHPNVQDAAVIGHTQAEGNKYLAAFCVAQTMPEISQLRTWLRHRLPAPAVPTVFHTLEHLPRNANGKIDRQALRKALDETRVEQSSFDLSPIQQAIINTYMEVLGTQNVHLASDFFLLGGTSLQAIQVSNRLSTQLQQDVPVSLLFRCPSPANLALVLENTEREGYRPPNPSNPFAFVLNLQAGEHPAVFCIHPAEGLSWCYWGLSAHLPNTALYGIQAQGLSGENPANIHTLVQSYKAAIQAQQTQGPYRLLGWSSGGGIAHAIACALQQEGHTVDLLALLDSYPSHTWANQPLAQESDAWEALLDVTGDSPVDEHGQPLSISAMKAKLQHPSSPLANLGEDDLQRMVDTGLHTMHLYRNLEHATYQGQVLFFQATQRGPDAPHWESWKAHVEGHIECIPIDSTHSGLCKRRPLTGIGQSLAQALKTLKPNA
jgi:nonribosomal peptide synthetase MxcG